MRAFFLESKVEKFPRPVQGIVEQTISLNQAGRVRCLGSYWPARFYQTDCEATVLPNQQVMVVAIEDITMLVIPVGYMPKNDM